MPVNGNASDNPHSILEKASSLWGRALGVDPAGHVQRCDKDRNGNRQENGIMIRRGSPDKAAQRAKCKQQTSYLAKVYSKDIRPKGAWTCGGTRTPRKQETWIRGGGEKKLPTVQSSSTPGRAREAKNFSRMIGSLNRSGFPALRAR